MTEHNGHGPRFVEPKDRAEALKRLDDLLHDAQQVQGQLVAGRPELSPEARADWCRRANMAIAYKHAERRFIKRWLTENTSYADIEGTPTSLLLKIVFGRTKRLEKVLEAAAAYVHCGPNSDDLAQRFDALADAVAKVERDLATIALDTRMRINA